MAQTELENITEVLKIGMSCGDEEKMLTAEVDENSEINSRRRALVEAIFAEPAAKKPRLDQQTMAQKVLKSKSDSERIKAIRINLHGVPPPPSLTNPRISIEDVVKKLDKYFDQTAENTSEIDAECQLTPITPEKVSLDVYYNDNLKCETLDFLYEKVRQRYIMNETSSFVSTAPKFTVINSPLPCDYLDMLPRSMSSPASPAPDILSAELAQRRSRMRPSSTKNLQPARKSPRKSSATAIKNPSLRLSGVAAQRDAFLLQVPQKEAPKVNKPATKFITIPKTKTSCGKDMLAKKSEEKIPKLDELSEIHQKKLNWATVTALQKFSPNLIEDAKFFKKCRLSLFRLCLVQWLKLQEAHAKDELKPVQGTSNRMLELATQLAPQVVNSMTAS